MINIITDTTCSVPVEELEASGIYVIPQVINFGNESLEDAHQISSGEFLRRLKSSKGLPSTAAPPPILYRPILTEILNRGDEALIITPSQKLSGTHRSATLASQEFPRKKIQILDTGSIAGGFGQMVLYAKAMADSGSTVEEIKAEISDLAARERVLFLVNTLDYLHKGGRIGRAAHLFGSLLQIKPILTLVDGAVAPYEKVRTFKQAIRAMEEDCYRVLESNPKGMPSIAHAENEVEGEALASRLEARLGLSPIPVYEAPPAIIVHTGPGLIVSSCFRKV